MNFKEAIELGKISKEEEEVAIKNLSCGINGYLIHFKKWDAEIEPIFNEHNQTLCAIDEYNFHRNNFLREWETERKLK